MDIGENYAHLYARNKKNKKRIYTDGPAVRKWNVFTVTSVNQRHNNTATLFFKGNRTQTFITQSVSGQADFIEDAEWRYPGANVRHLFDSVYSHHANRFVIGCAYAQNNEKNYITHVQDIVSNYRAALRINLSPMRMYQVSLTGAMVVGMVSMSLIYNNLGQSAFAQDDTFDKEAKNETDVVRVIKSAVDEKDLTDKNDAKKEDKSENEDDVINVEDKKTNDVKNENNTEIVMSDIVQKDKKASDVQKNELEEVEDVIIEETKSRSVDSATKKEEKNKSLEELAYETVDGYPIEKMLPYILEQDPEVAKYLIAIAKQESQWGKRVPVLNGQDCYNYWGYRGQRKLMGTGGHTCFNSREDAVRTVGKRLHTLIYDNDRKTASKLIVWKCGSTCDGHSQEGVDRWINVVKSYYDKLSRG